MVKANQRLCQKIWASSCKSWSFLPAGLGRSDGEQEPWEYTLVKIYEIFRISWSQSFWKARGLQNMAGEQLKRHQYFRFHGRTVNWQHCKVDPLVESEFDHQKSLKYYSFHNRGVKAF